MSKTAAKAAAVGAVLALAAGAGTVPSAAGAADPGPYDVQIGQPSDIYQATPYDEPWWRHYPAVDLPATSPCVVGETPYWTVNAAWQDGRRVAEVPADGLGQGESYCDDTGQTGYTFTLYRHDRPYLHAGWLWVEVQVRQLSDDTLVDVQRQRVWVPRRR